MSAKRHRLVWVEWMDATLISGLEWESVSELKSEGCHLHSAGMLVKEDAGGYYLAGDVDPENSDRVRCVSFIPRRMVVRMKTFRI